MQTLENWVEATNFVVPKQRLFYGNAHNFLKEL